jgi:hypothetical protein
MARCSIKLDTLLAMDIVGDFGDAYNSFLCVVFPLSVIVMPYKELLKSNRISGTRISA